MASIRLELYTSKTLNDGRHPITITVTKDTKVKRKTIGRALVKEWDEVNKTIKKNKPTHVFENQELVETFLRYKKKYNDLLYSNEAWSAADVFEEELIIPEYKEGSFLEYANEYLETLDLKSGYRETVYYRVEKIKRFHPKPFFISDIDERWIKMFEKHCREKEKNKNGETGNSRNTINDTFKTIKTIISFAGQTNVAINRRKAKTDEVVKLKLTEAEISAIENLKLSGVKDHYRNAFLVQYYARGMRIGDVLRLRKANVKEGRLIYVTGKTNKPHTIRIIPKLMSILDRYLDGDGFLFPFMKGDADQSKEDLSNQITYRTTKINEALKEIMNDLNINKAITTHNARHSFAAMADKKLGGDLKDVQAMLGHSSRAMTERYIKELRKSDEMDDIADKLFD